MGRDKSEIINLQGKSVGKILLPGIFMTPVRDDLIKKAVIALQSHRIQPQGRDPLAGKRTTAESKGTGRGMSRIPTLKNIGRAALAPSTVGGRRTHPPVATKRIYKKIPYKERRLALFSAIAATGLREKVSSRGHVIDDISDLPLVVTDDIQKIEKTKDLKDVLLNLGVWPDIYRVIESVKVRAGKGKGRGRRKKKSVGPLIVITNNEGVFNAGSNLIGVDISTVKNLNVELLAPGTHSGRLTIWTNSSIKNMEKIYRGR